MNNVKVSVIFVNYKSLRLIKKAIFSIIDNKTGVSYEIIVSDNSAQPKNESTLKKLSEKIKYIRNKINVGYGMGINKAAREARGEYLFILNPDTVVEKGTIDILVRFLDRDTKAGIVAPLLTDFKGKVYQQGVTELTPKKAIFVLSFINKLFPNNKLSREYFIKDWNEKTTKEADVVPGTAFMMRRSLFEKVGGFDEKIFLFFEEFDLCRRVKNMGKKLYIIPQAKVKHHWGESTKQESDDLMKIYFQKSRYYYFKKHFGISSALVVELVLRIKIETLLMLAVILAAVFLRFSGVVENYPWGGEQGTNYLELKNYYENGQIPLKGPLTGRSWLQLQPLYYWIMMPIFILFSWNPIIPAYFFAIISIIMAFINYKFVREWFGDFVAKVSTTIVLISPFWIRLTKDSRFFFLMTLFSYFYFHFLIKAFRERSVNIVYYAIFVLFLMLHLHYVALVFIPSLLLFLFQYRKKVSFSWRKGIIYAIFPSIPFLLVNIKENFEPLIKTIVWIPYRVAGFLGVIEKNNISISVITDNIESLLLIYRWQFYWTDNTFAYVISVILILFSIYIYFRPKKSSHKIPQSVILLSFFVTYIALFIHGSPAYHYYVGVILVPPLIIGLLLEQLKERYSVISGRLTVFIVIIVMLLLNQEYYLSQYFFKNNKSTMTIMNSYPVQLQVAENITKDAGNNHYSLKRVGAFDYYDGYHAQNYQYLLWWMGNEPKEGSDILYTIYDDINRFNEIGETEIVFKNNGVIVTKKSI